MSCLPYDRSAHTNIWAYHRFDNIINCPHTPAAVASYFLGEAMMSYGGLTNRKYTYGQTTPRKASYKFASLCDASPTHFNQRYKVSRIYSVTSNILPKMTLEYSMLVHFQTSWLVVPYIFTVTGLTVYS